MARSRLYRVELGLGGDRLHYEVGAKNETEACVSCILHSGVNFGEQWAEAQVIACEEVEYEPLPS